MSKLIDGLKFARCLKREQTYRSSMILSPAVARNLRIEWNSGLF